MSPLLVRLNTTLYRLMLWHCGRQSSVLLLNQLMANLVVVVTNHMGRYRWVLVFV